MPMIRNLFAVGETTASTGNAGVTAPSTAPAAVPAAAPPALPPLQAWPRMDVILVSAPESAVAVVKNQVHRHINARVLDNPHRDANLRPYWGMHPVIVDYVKKDPKLEPLLDGVVDGLLDVWMNSSAPLPLIVVTTCVGGHHRSVAVNRILLDRVVDKLGFNVMQMGHTRHLPVQTPMQLLLQSDIHIITGLPPDQCNQMAQLRFTTPNVGWTNQPANSHVYK